MRGYFYADRSFMHLVDEFVRFLRRKRSKKRNYTGGAISLELSHSSSKSY
jgi:hypothetical protein